MSCLARLGGLSRLTSRTWPKKVCHAGEAVSTADPNCPPAFMWQVSAPDKHFSGALARSKSAELLGSFGPNSESNCNFSEDCQIDGRRG